MTTANRGERGTGDTIRVVIVDDQSLVRSGLRFFLLAFEDLELVGEAAGGRQAVELCRELQPDVVLMDLMMPGMSGTDATREIRKCCPHARVIILTNFHGGESVQGALRAGATSYLLKNVTADELGEAIRAAHAGRATLAQEATEALIEVTTARPRLGDDLTPRERDVLALLVEGLSNPEIAERLVIGLSTVKFHISGIYSKLEVSSRAEAVALAWQHHLVSGLGD